MLSSNRPQDITDAYELNRFVRAQEKNYDRALSEITNGRKRSHWMWYVFPQIDGLARSSTAKRYSIKSLAEARAYLGHTILGPRLLECMQAVICIEGRSARQIFGSPDDLKLNSCATLFAGIQPAGSMFHQLIAKYFEDKPDAKTIKIIERLA